MRAMPAPKLAILATVKATCIQQQYVKLRFVRIDVRLFGKKLSGWTKMTVVFSHKPWEAWT